MIIEIEYGDPTVVEQYAELAASYEAVADSLSVVVVNPGDANTPGMAHIKYRPVELAEVQPEDDVVIVYAPDAGRLVRDLFRRLGTRMPRVLVVAPAVDSYDICQALAQGATSYLIEGYHIKCMGEAVAKTAIGLSCLDPRVAGVLAQQGRHTVDQVSSRMARDADTDTDDAPITSPLTTRETEIMELIAVGYSVAEVAARLLLSERTVRNNLTNIYAKLQVRRQSEAVLLWLGYRPRHGRDGSPAPAVERARQHATA